MKTHWIIAIFAGLTIACAEQNLEPKKKKSESKSDAPEDAAQSSIPAPEAEGAAPNVEGSNTPPPVSPDDAPDAEGFALNEGDQDAVEVATEEALGDEASEQDDDLSLAPSQPLLGRLSLERNGSASRRCEEENGAAVVTIDRDMSNSANAEGPNGKASRHVERSYHATRTWSKEGGEVHCNAAGNAVRLQFGAGPLSHDGLRLEANFERHMERAVSGESAAGESASRSVSASSKGSRDISLSIKDDAGSLVVSKTVRLSVERLRTIVDRDGKEHELSTSVQTVEGQPLTITRVLNKTLPVVAEKTVNGALVSKRMSGNVVELTFKNVKLTRGKGICERRSGEITGKVSKDGKLLKEFTIDFDADQAKIKLEDGSEKEFHPAICQD